MSHSAPLSPKSLAPGGRPPEDGDEEMIDAEEEAAAEEEQTSQQEPENRDQQHASRPPRETRKDRDLNDFLIDMDKYAPIVPFPTHIYASFPLRQAIVYDDRSPMRSPIITFRLPASSAPTRECIPSSILRFTHFDCAVNAFWLYVRKSLFLIWRPMHSSFPKFDLRGRRRRLRFRRWAHE